MGSENASMPTKCMAQMPVPIASAPQASHSAVRTGDPVAATTRVAMSSATNEAITAVTMDSATSSGS